VGTRSLVTTADLTPIYTRLLTEWAGIDLPDPTATPSPPDDDPDTTPAD
jgi:hypothetical protein